MARPSSFTATEMLDAAVRLIASGGPAATTVAALSKELSAPTGSIYHRFASRDEIVAQAWLATVSAFQDEFLRLLALEDESPGLQAALHTPAWVRRFPVHSTLLLRYHQKDLLVSPWPPVLAQQAADLRTALVTGLRDFTRRMFGRVSKTAFARCQFAVIGVPYGAVMPYLGSGPPPPLVDSMIETTYHAILGDRRQKEDEP